MASNEEAFLTLVVRKQSISIEGFVWMVLYVSSIVMILPSELNNCVLKDYTIFAIESLVAPSVYDATALQQKNACRHSYNLVIQLL